VWTAHPGEILDEKPLVDIFSSIEFPIAVLAKSLARVLSSEAVLSTSENFFPLVCLK
jgi:hypothetical protein